MPVLQDPIVNMDTAFFYKGGWKDNIQMCAHVIALGEGWGFIFQAMSPFSPEQLCGEGQL